MPDHITPAVPHIPRRYRALPAWEAISPALRGPAALPPIALGTAVLHPVLKRSAALAPAAPLLAAAALLAVGSVACVWTSVRGGADRVREHATGAENRTRRSVSPAPHVHATTTTTRSQGTSDA